MRWKGLLFLAIVIALFIGFTLFFTDYWLENKLESAGSYLNGAKVDIDNLHVSFTELYVRWDRLQVTNPDQTMKNKFETGKCEFDFEVIPLISDKLIIESFTITDIKTNTDRTEDGKIEIDKDESDPGFLSKTIDQLEQEVSGAVSPQLSSLKSKANIDSILKVMDIRSVEKIKNLQVEISEKYGKWENKLTGLKIEEDLTKIESQIKSIDVNKIKTPESGFAALEKVDKIYKTIKSNSDIVDDIKINLTADLKNIESQTSQVDDWIKQDYNRALSLAKIPDFNAENIGKLIFGKNIVNQINTYLGYIALARNSIENNSSQEPEKESPPRLQGQDIYFYNKNARPDFWIKKMNLSGETEDQLRLEGLAENIVSDQRLIGAPTKIAIGGKSNKGIVLSLDGILNYLGEQPGESFKLNYSGFSLANYQISKSNLFPNKIDRGIGSVSTELDLKADEILGRLTFKGKNLSFNMSEQNRPNSEIENIIQSVVKDLSVVDISADISGRADNLQFAIRSNLDNILADKMKAVVGEKIDKIRREIQSGVDKEVGKYRNELDKLTQDKEKWIQKEVKKYEAMVSKETNRADAKKKEIENVYAKEKSKIEQKVKDIFKF